MSTEHLLFLGGPLDGSVRAVEVGAHTHWAVERTGHTLDARFSEVPYYRRAVGAAGVGKRDVMTLGGMDPMPLLERYLLMRWIMEGS